MRCNARLRTWQAHRAVLRAAFEGDTEALGRLLKLYPGAAAAVDVFGFSPLCLAAYRGHDAAVRLLLAHGEDVNGAVRASRFTVGALKILVVLLTVAAVTLAAIGGCFGFLPWVGPRYSYASWAALGLLALLLLATTHVVAPGPFLVRLIDAPPTWHQCFHVWWCAWCKRSDGPQNGDTPLHLSQRMGHVGLSNTLMSLGARVDLHNELGQFPSMLSRRQLPLSSVVPLPELEEVEEPAFQPRPGVLDPRVGELLSKWNLDRLAPVFAAHNINIFMLAQLGDDQVRNMGIAAPKDVTAVRSLVNAHRHTTATTMFNPVAPQPPSEAKLPRNVLLLPSRRKVESSTPKDRVNWLVHVAWGFLCGLLFPFGAGMYLVNKCGRRARFGPRQSFVTGWLCAIGLIVYACWALPQSAWPTCQSTHDCLGGSKYNGCQDSTCTVLPACSLNSHCADVSAGHSESGFAYTGCAAPRDCAAFEPGATSACAADVDCPAGFVCNPATFGCENPSLKPCVLNSDCGLCQYCHNGYCDACSFCTYAYVYGCQ